MELLKLLDTSQIVAQVISFLILFFILRILVWKRFLKALDDRRDHIAAEFKAIEDKVLALKADLEARKNSNEALIAEIKAIETDISREDNRKAATRSSGGVVQSSKRMLRCCSPLRRKASASYSVSFRRTTSETLSWWKCSTRG